MDNLLVMLVVFLFIFLICREIICWYWKINNIVDLLERIDKSLKDISTKLPQQTKAATSVDSTTKGNDISGKTLPDSSPVHSESFNCPKCGLAILIAEQKYASNGLTQCPHCKAYFKVQME